MSKSCSGLLDAYVACVAASACVAARGPGSLKACATDGAAVPECAQARELVYVCKRGQLDMRTRIRGNKGY